MASSRLSPSTHAKPQLRVLIACECSGAVRRAFRERGHDAWSCDLKPAEDGGEHIRGDAVEAAYTQRWDMLIAHPVCRYLANSGAKHLYRGMNKANGPDPERWQAMADGAAFFLRFWRAPIARIAVENPIMVGHAKRLIGVRQTQVIQPWMFGHPESKATCLWLKGLPRLTPTQDVRAGMMLLPVNERNRVHYAPPGPEREANRSRTLPGIAAAMAGQWGDQPADLFSVAA
jgi:hypothetical protein